MHILCLQMPPGMIRKMIRLLFLQASRTLWKCGQLIYCLLIFLARLINLIEGSEACLCFSPQCLMNLVRRRRRSLMLIFWKDFRKFLEGSYVYLCLHLFLKLLPELYIRWIQLTFAIFPCTHIFEMCRKSNCCLHKKWNLIKNKTFKKLQKA